MIRRVTLDAEIFDRGARFSTRRWRVQLRTLDGRRTFILGEFPTEASALYMIDLLARRGARTGG